MKDLALPIPERAFMAPLGAAPFGDHGGAISGFMVWLRLLLACWTHGWTEDNRHKKYFQGGKRAPSLLPASARAASAPCLRANRQARRITAAQASGLAPICGFASLKRSKAHDWAIYGAGLPPLGQWPHRDLPSARTQKAVPMPRSVYRRRV